MLRIFDCSNSPRRPLHRGGGGPFQNDVMRQLREYAASFDCEFVDTLDEADVAITNDVFPTEVLEKPVRKVKRMDGVFFQEKLKDRNERLNAAALQADHVIFISEDSKAAYTTLYGKPLKECSVVLNCADPVDYPRKLKTTTTRPMSLVATATDWSRPEKRLDAVLNLAVMMTGTLHLIGTMPPEYSLPLNVVLHGYLEKPQDVADICTRCDAMVSLAYRDAAPKTVAQGIAIGLPVLYTSHGGVPELVWDCGTAVLESAPIQFEELIPSIDLTLLQNAWHQFEDQYVAYVDAVYARDPHVEFQSMLAGYFKALRAV